MKDMFEDMVERLLGDLVTAERVMAAERGDWPSEIWDALEEQGLTLAAVPEALGGVGGSWHDAFVLIRAAGRHCAPVPLAETIGVNWLLGRAGMAGVAGPATLAVADKAVLDGAHFSGEIADVPWGRSVRLVLVRCAAPDDAKLVLLDTRGAAVQPGINIAREARDRLTFDRAPIIAEIAGASGPEDEILLLCGASIRSAQIAGGLQRLLATTIDYANQRVQFGRPIGKFQAIQHQIALLAEQAGIATAAAETAFANVHPMPHLQAVATAKSVASEAAGAGAAIAHGVLGAIGFTYEHALQLTTRRLWSWRSEFGSQSYWATRLGEATCRVGADGFWSALTAGALGAA